ncbi:hypothetical protein HK096_005532, partial [Nowakowskiella sp. JEL0078]
MGFGCKLSGAPHLLKHPIFANRFSPASSVLVHPSTSASSFIRRNKSSIPASFKTSKTGHELNKHHPWLNQQRSAESPSSALPSPNIQTVVPPKIDVSAAHPEVKFGSRIQTDFSRQNEALNKTVHQTSNMGSGEASSSHSQPMAKWETTNVRPYKDRSLLELLNSYLVFQLCRIPYLTSFAAPVISISEKLFLSVPVYAVVKRTFFAHFCGGENISEVSPTMAKLQSRNVGSILDLAMEADIDTASLLGDESRRQAVKIRILMQESIDIAATQPHSFIAMKATAFVPPVILQRWTNTLRRIESMFKESDVDNNGMLTLSEFVKFVLRLSGVKDTLQGASIAATAEQVFDDNKGVGFDWIRCSDLFSVGNTHSRVFVRDILNLAAANEIKDDRSAQWHDLNDIMTKEDWVTLDGVLEEVESLCAYSNAKKVRIMVDAEQTYFQPAIDDIALSLRAYLTSERRRAETYKYPDPINSTIENTHKEYNKAIDLLVSKVSSHITQTGNAISLTTSAQTIPISFVVASHNKSSIQHAREVMSSLPSHFPQQNEGDRQPIVAFAQLMGMQDGTSFGLAANGYKAYKYVPYGPLNVTIPYLLRRAQENSSLLGGAGQDRKDIVAE